MSSPVHRMLSVASLVSRIPVKLAEPPDFSAADFWMPVVGLGAAAFGCAGAALGLLLFGPGTLAAVLAMTAQYLSFNLFHLDGLLDTADAAGVFGDAEKRRAALKDPRIGSFALFAGFASLAGRLGATSALMARGGALVWGALILAPVTGRFASMLVTCAAKPFSSGGLSALIGRPSPVKAAIGYAIAALPAALLFGVAFGPLGAVAAILGGGIVAVAAGTALGLWYGKKLGGYSGDALGAAVELAELAVLIIAAAL